MERLTLTHLVTESYADRITKDTYLICMNEDCNLVYYSSDNEDTFYKNDVNWC